MMQTLLNKHWHHLDSTQISELLDTNQDQGLDRLEIEKRQKHFGPNAIPIRKEKGPILIFLSQFHQPLVYILLAAVVVTMLLNEWIDSAVIFGVVFVNAIIGFVQESKAARALEALARSMTSTANVVRSEERQQVASEELVPGDVVLLQSGDKVPADIRLVHCRDLQTDESALTGESLPVQKGDAPLEKDTVLAERRNMAYSSTLVTYGQARGIVVATGAKTEVGRISNLIANAIEVETPLTRRIAKFSHLLVYIILALAAATFAVGLWRHQSVGDMFMAAVALVVGAIPEGLPAAVTIILAIGVHRMAVRRSIIRKLPAVETLGSTTVICSDKTGTLTENAMTVAEIWTPGVRFSTTGIGYSPSGEIVSDEGSADLNEQVALRECLTAGLLCNDSVLRSEEGRWSIQGDPTEGALMVVAAKAGLNELQERERLPRLDSVPFESEHQYMATLHDGQPQGPRTTYIKGAVERVLARCENMMDSNGKLIPLDSESIQAEFENMASRGLRVLAFASRTLPVGQQTLRHQDIEGGLVFLGLQGMIDPPRQEAIDAVSACQQAGVRVKMITGDHALTALAIAKKLGINRLEEENEQDFVTGSDLEQLTDEDLIKVVNHVSVFARVTPEQKLRLVRALQAQGHVVAMTGDGVNDAPALKQADIGVAMGISGTEAAKEAADMVLTDDNFASIKAAVEEGRGVFDNLTKFILWTLPTNIGEGLVILAAIFAGVALPILPVQILWINMTTAVLLGLMLAFEPKEPRIMSRKPRDPQTPILSGVLLGRIALVSLILLAGSFGLFEWALISGLSEATARTVTVNVFVFVQIFYLFNCRSLTHSMFHVGLFSNPWIWFGVGAMIVLQLLYTYTPTMNRVFGSAPIQASHWALILSVALIAYTVVGLEKWIRRRLSKRHLEGNHFVTSFI